MSHICWCLGLLRFATGSDTERKEEKVDKEKVDKEMKLSLLTQHFLNCLGYRNSFEAMTG